jgi:hypothetical protein
MAASRTNGARRRDKRRKRPTPATSNSPGTTAIPVPVVVDHFALAPAELGGRSTALRIGDT